MCRTELVGKELLYMMSPGVNRDLIDVDDDVDYDYLKCSSDSP